MTIQLKQKIRNTVKFMQKHPWCKESLARDKNGFAVSLSSSKAYAFCAIGAFRKANPHVGSNTENAFNNIFSQEVGTRLIYFNDNLAKNKQEVINKLKTLIK